MIRIAAEGIALDFAPDLGRIDGFAVTDGGRAVAPLHRAPWVGTEEELRQALEHGARDRVHALRPIEGQCGDSVVHLIQDLGSA